MKNDSLDFEIAFFEGLAKKNPNYADALIPLAAAYTRKGLYEKGLKIDQRLAQLRKEDPVVHYNLACSFALVGKKDEAFQALERSIQLGYSDFEHLKKDSDLKSLRSDVRFQTLLDQTKRHTEIS
jgi:tetratricopeptide (TPR) repeat protein